VQQGETVSEYIGNASTRHIWYTYTLHANMHTCVSGCTYTESEEKQDVNIKFQM
jgi:hypothetical protein